MLCDNLVPGTTYTFNLWVQVPAGESLVQVDESMSGFEVVPFDINLGHLPPIPNAILNPVAGTCNDGTINITWLTFTDPNNNLDDYNISLLNSDGSFNTTINASTTKLYQAFDTTPFANGQYYIQVEGCDLIGLCATSNVTFFIDNTAPVVSLVSPPDNYINNQPTSVNLTFTCSVTDTCNLKNISLYITDTNNLNFALNQTSMISGASSTVNWSLQLPQGNYTWSCLAYDFAGNPGWGVNRSIQIRNTIWHSFCGNVSGQLILGNNKTNVDVMYNWSWDQSGNIYSYNSDATINWNSLVALGRTSLGAVSTNDFLEVDTLLNTTVYKDNVTVTFSTDGTNAKATRTFVVSTSSIANVPIANSTNSSNFVTGILWDSSDDTGNNEFDATDSEDLVFVTEINVTKRGSCGIKDYEIRVPGTLDTYKGGTGTVDFVSELSI